MKSGAVQAICLLALTSVCVGFLESPLASCSSVLLAKIHGKPLAMKADGGLSREEFLGASASLGLAAFSLPAVANAARMSRYFEQVNEGVVSFSYPSNWQATRARNGITVRDDKTKDAMVFRTFSLDLKEDGTPIPLEDAQLRNLIDPLLDPTLTDDVRFAWAKLDERAENTYRVVPVKYTALSPSSRTVERQGQMVATQVGNDFYVLLASSTSVRWKKDSSDLLDMMSSFSVTESTKKSRSSSSQGIEALEKIQAKKSMGL
eukprot:CAMPEP_0113936220 /NCGR_PEP_ID=MMETSP1339-20121228/3177_1 /TAXON_ID=94617 /ORGANISM="Fibrocapsa japonica" /LENGTH=261 /DNA_ID=CAMNT_0000938609 /DNA_START=69 /DNA_END=854 /DNA_ORIENTATION=+ /assembly_acc=CAM_ASM_000762